MSAVTTSSAPSKASNSTPSSTSPTTISSTSSELPPQPLPSYSPAPGTVVDTHTPTSFQLPEFFLFAHESTEGQARPVLCQVYLNEIGTSPPKVIPHIHCTYISLHILYLRTLFTCHCVIIFLLPISYYHAFPSSCLGYSMDELQELSYYLCCHTQRTGRASAVPAPLLHADDLARKARVFHDCVRLTLIFSNI